MGPLWRTIFIMFMCGIFQFIRGEICSSEETAIKFSQCLMEQILKSPYFYFNDQNDIVEVTNLMINAMREVKYGTREDITLRALAVSYITSVANIVILKDLAFNQNVLRKAAYIRALNQCSISSIGYIDSYFIHEAMQILQVLHRNKTRNNTEHNLGVNKELAPDSRVQQNSNFNRQIWNPSIIQPSPVQKNFAPYLEEENKPSSWHESGSFKVPTPTRETVPGFGFQYPSYPAIDIKSSPNSNVPKEPLYKEEPKFPAFGSVVASSMIKESLLPSFKSYPTFKDLNNPRTKDSSITLIPEADRSRFPIIIPAQHDVLQPVQKSSTQYVETKDSVKSSSQPEVNFGFSYPKLHAISLDSFAHPDISEVPFNEKHPNFSPPVSGDAIKESFSSVFNPHSTFAGVDVLQSQLKESFNPIQKPQNPHFPVIMPSQKVLLMNETNNQSTGKVNSSLIDNVNYKAPKEITSNSDDISSSTQNTFSTVPTEVVPLLKMEGQVQGDSVIITNETYYTGDKENSAFIENFGTNSTFAFPDATEDFEITNKNESSQSSIASIISDILMNSTSFVNTFSSDSNKEDIINIALTITEQSLHGYDADIVEEAMKSVSNAVTSLTLRSPENFATAISNALGTVLNLHNISLFIPDTDIESSRMTTLNSQEQDYTEYDEDMNENHSLELEVTTIEEPRQVPIDFQFPILVPEDVAGGIFSNSLKQYLAGSVTIAGFYCDQQPVSDPMSYFNVIKQSLFDYGSQISQIAASTISEELVELDKELLCSKYAQLIADGIAVILSENGLIQSSNPEDILSRMEFSVVSLKDIALRNQNTPKTLNNRSFITEYNMVTPITEFELITEIPLTNNYSELEQTAFKQHLTYNNSTNESTNNGKNVDEPLNYNVHSSTEAVSTQIADDDEITNVFDYMTTLTDIPESVLSKGPEDDVYEYTFPSTDTVATFLMKEMESIMDSMKLKDTKTEYTTNTGEFISEFTTIGPQLRYESMTTVEQVSEITSSNTYNQTSEIHTSELQPQSKGVTPRVRNARKNKRKHHNRKKQQPHLDADSEIKSHVIEEFISDAEDEISSSNKTRKHEITSHDFKTENQSPSVSSNTKSNSPVMELKPSFRGPPSYDTDPKIEVHSSSSYHARYDDSTLLTARRIAQITTSSIQYIRSSDNFNLEELCITVNELAAVVSIPPLENCKEIPMIDYLLHALRSATKILSDI